MRVGRTGSRGGTPSSAHSRGAAGALPQAACPPLAHAGRRTLAGKAALPLAAAHPLGKDGCWVSFEVALHWATLEFPIGLEVPFSQVRQGQGSGSRQQRQQRCIPQLGAACLLLRTPHAGVLPPARTMVVARDPLLDVQLAFSVLLSSSVTQAGCRATLPQRLQRPASRTG